MRIIIFRVDFGVLWSFLWKLIDSVNILIKICVCYQQQTIICKICLWSKYPKFKFRRILFRNTVCCHTKLVPSYYGCKPQLSWLSISTPLLGRRLRRSPSVRPHSKLGMRSCRGWEQMSYRFYIWLMLLLWLFRCLVVDFTTIRYYLCLRYF